MSLSLLDWRRQVHRLYATVRAAADPIEGHELWRAGRDRLFAEHPDSPLPAEERARFHGLPVAPYDPSLRFDTELDTAVPALTWSTETDTDGIVPFSRIGVVHLDGVGDLDVWWLESYGGGVFLPVRDAAPDTYGGGRYLLDTVKGADLGGDARSGRLVVDLNFAYNPSCAYSPAWTCPLAPSGNTLSIPLPGGERTH
jgi:uncharacterized protein (DUF1684 family)